MENEIFRKPTEADKQFIDVNLNRPKRQKTSREKFTIELHKHEQEAVKKHLPFAAHAARDDFEIEIKKQINEQIRMYNEIRYPEQLLVPKMDWKKYSDIKNFTIESEYDKPDEHLSGRNPGLTVEVRTTVYKYKGYGNTYRVMEEPQMAVRRAQQVVWDARSKHGSDKPVQQPNPA